MELRLFFMGYEKLEKSVVKVGDDYFVADGGKIIRTEVISLNQIKFKYASSENHILGEDLYSSPNGILVKKNGEIYVSEELLS